jgi:lipoprotein-releasing system ATP-binding protein
MLAPLLELKEVIRRYAAVGRSSAVPVINGVSLSVASGETLAIVGPSGSGKSTLLQIIGTLDRASSGEVLLGGKNLAALDEVQLAEVRNRKIGFVFQSHFLLPQCTVWENVMVPSLAVSKTLPVATDAETTEARAARLLRRVGLGDRINHRPGQLSGGERQRVAVVRALINKPQLLLADEPSGALDHASATALGGLLIELNREEDVTLIVVTHAMELARQMSRVFELRDGNLVATA